MINEKYFREYDYLGDTVYVDVCSMAVQPERTLKICEGFQREFVQSLGRVCLTEYEGRRRDAAAGFARLIGARADEILFETNTTRGFQMLSGQLPLDKGDKVLFCPEDYPSVYSHWRARGVPCVELSLKDGRLDEDALIALLDREPVRIVCISHVFSCSGYRVDLEKIGMACRKRGVYLCVDAIQGLGRNVLDVKRCNIAVLSCGGFKGLLGVLGTGAHYVRSDLLQKMHPDAYDGENCCCDSTASNNTFAIQRAMQLHAGSQNTYGIVALGESLGMLLEIGMEEIQAQVRRLEEIYREQLADLNLHWIGDTDGRHRSGNAVFLCDSTQHDEMKRIFAERNIMVHLHADRLRVGFHYYNTPEHVLRLTQAIHEAFGK